MNLFKENRIILDLCGGSGAWSKPYRDAGYDVRLVTLPGEDVRLYSCPDKVHGILAAPPCTEFSLARNGHPGISPDYLAGLSVVDACFRLAYVHKPYFFALENPLGKLGNFLGKHHFFYHPWWFGDPFTKRTCLWGWFIRPCRKYFDINDAMNPEEIRKCRLNLGVRQHAGVKGRAARRAVTPAGFAKAFFEVNP